MDCGCSTCRFGCNDAAGLTPRTHDGVAVERLHSICMLNYIMNDSVVFQRALKDTQGSDISTW